MRTGGFCALILGSLLLAGCYSVGPAYLPRAIDGKTGLYTGETSFGTRDILKRDVNVDLTGFRFVHLDTRTDLYPDRFEFLVRAALVRMGFTQVLNSKELSDLINSDPKLSPYADKEDWRVQVSRMVGPFLTVQFYSSYQGFGRRSATVYVQDSSKEEFLLMLNFEKGSGDEEACYPALNELKKWFDDCSRGKGGASL